MRFAQTRFPRAWLAATATLAAGLLIMLTPQSSAEAEDACTVDPAGFETCTSSGTAQLVHTLFDLDPDEQGASTLECPYTGIAELRMDGGWWQVVYRGEDWHHQEGLAFVCGGGSGGDIIAAGPYTIDPLSFSLDEGFACGDDTFSFDGTTLSGVMHAYCTNRDVYTFSVTLGAAAETTVPADGPVADETTLIASDEEADDVATPGTSVGDAGVGDGIPTDTGADATGGHNAQSPFATDGDDSTFPFLILVVAILVVLGVIAAAGVFRGWDRPGRRQRKPAPGEVGRDSEQMGRYVLGLDRYPGEGGLNMTEREWEESGRPTYTVTKVDTDNDGVDDKERVVVHRDGFPDEIRFEDIVDPPPPDPVQQAYIDWAVDQVAGADPPRYESDLERQRREDDRRRDVASIRVDPDLTDPLAHENVDLNPPPPPPED